MSQSINTMLLAIMLCFLSAWVDPTMLVLSKEPYISQGALLFQRCSVMASDIVLLAALTRYFRGDKTASLMVPLLFLNPSLLLIDHVHFQYNGFLLGVLLYAIAMLKEGRSLFSGILFAVALNLKHINLYVAPVFFVHLLRQYCFQVNVEEQSISNGRKETKKTVVVHHKGWSWCRFILILNLES